MSLDYEIEDDGTQWDWAAVGQAGRKVDPTPGYTGVGEEPITEVDGVDPAAPLLE